MQSSYATIIQCRQRPLQTARSRCFGLSQTNTQAVCVQSIIFCPFLSAASMDEGIPLIPLIYVTSFSLCNYCTFFIFIYHFDSSLYLAAVIWFINVCDRKYFISLSFQDINYFSKYSFTLNSYLSFNLYLSSRK